MFYKFRCAVARFMYGRNGMDQMNQALLRGYLVILVAQLIFSLLRLWIPARICESLLWVLMVFILFRMFSKNLTKRRAENQKFMGWIWKARNNAAGAKARRADKEHKYFTCRCGAICRVPVGKGKIVITCPKCGNCELQTLALRFNIRTMPFNGGELSPRKREVTSSIVLNMDKCIFCRRCRLSLLLRHIIIVFSLINGNPVLVHLNDFVRQLI